MELVERYVKAVSRRLPAAKRASVEAELRSAILDAIEGRGAQDDDDVVAVLREFGDPAHVAAGYDTRGQYLIGPELYPSFLRVLRHALLAVVALSGVLFAVRFATSYEPMAVAGEELLDAIDRVVDFAIMAVIVVTVTFVVMQRTGAKLPSSKSREFDPRALPALFDADRVNRFEAAFSLLVLAVAMAFLGAILHEARHGVMRAPSVLRPLVDGAILAGIPWLLASMLAEAVMQAGLLVEGRRRFVWRALHVVSDALAMIGFGIAGTAVLAGSGALESVGVPEVVPRSVGVTLLLIALVIPIATVAREVRATRRRAAERASSSGRSAGPSGPSGDDRPTPPTARTATA